MSQNDLENGAAIRNREVQKDTHRWKDKKFLMTILNSKCQTPFRQISQKAGRSTKSGLESHLSYFHMKEIIEIIGVFGVEIG